MSLREQRRLDQRQRIVDAARGLFAEQGADGVTMAEVAAAAGVARATVFNYFGSKHALIEGITEDVLEYYRVILENALADQKTPTTALIRAMFDGMGRGIEEDARFHRGIFREIAKIRLGLDEGSAAQIASQTALELLVQLLERGQARGELSRAHRPEDLASAFTSLLDGTITHWLYDNASEPLHARMARVAEVFLAPVASEPLARYRGRKPVLAAPRTRAKRPNKGRVP